MKNIENVTFTPVNQETEAEKWAELRTTGIGGSDAGAIMGLNKYASPLTVYFSKKGIERDFSGNNATKWGHLLEDPIRQETANELEVVIDTVGGMYTSNEHPFMNANLDGIMTIPEGKIVILGGAEFSGVGGHEIKTSSNGDGFSEDEIPDSYYAQCQHYMAVTGFDWFVLTVFILSTRTLKHYPIRRNEEFIEELIKAEENFWNNNVLADVPPAPIGLDSEDEYIKNLPMSEVIELDESTIEIIDEERKLDEQIKELTKRQKALKDEILMSLSRLSTGSVNAEKVLATGGNWKISYNTQTRKTVDSDSLKKAGLYEQYSKESVSKVLRISEVKA